MARKKRKNRNRPARGFFSCVDWDVDDAGRLVAVDETGNRLLIEQPDGRFREIGCRGDGPSEFHYPRSVAVLDGRAYVVDSWNHRVQVFGIPSGDLQGAFGRFGDGEGEFRRPGSIRVVGSDGAAPWLAVADTDNRRVTLHERDGRYLFSVDTNHDGHPRKMEVRDGFIRVQYDDGAWVRLS